MDQSEMRLSHLSSFQNPGGARGDPKQTCYKPINLA